MMFCLLANRFRGLDVSVNASHCIDNEMQKNELGMLTQERVKDRKV